jgi:hypothetical protein
MTVFPTIKEIDMAGKIIHFAGRWKNVIALWGLLITCYLLVTASTRSSVQQEEIITLLTKNQRSIMEKQDRQDTINARFTTNIDKVALAIDRIIDRQDNWEIEHIKLMKLHGVYPEKLYRGSIK